MLKTDVEHSNYKLFYDIIDKKDKQDTIVFDIRKDITFKSSNLSISLQLNVVRNKPMICRSYLYDIYSA